MPPNARHSDTPSTYLIRYVTIKRFAELSGYTQDAVRTKIRDDVWREREVWIRAPDNRVLIDLVGFEAWASSITSASDSPSTAAPESAEEKELVSWFAKATIPSGRRSQRDK